MPDDLDDLLRGAMKSLDDQVPSGYFDALPDQTLKRLEATPMEPTRQATPATRDAKSAVPAKVRDEDSGLHDIRNLAQSTKQRLSSKRMGSQGPSEEDVLAQTSAGWKAVALPEPAKMVSLPSIDELPSKAEVLAKEKAPAPIAAVEAPVAAATSAVEPSRAPVMREMFARPAPKKTGRNIALFGMGLAAAAGVTIWVMQRDNGQSNSAASAPGSAEVARAEPEKPKVEAVPAAAPPPPPTPAPDEGAANAADGSAATGAIGDATTVAKVDANKGTRRGASTKDKKYKGVEGSTVALEQATKTPPPTDNKKSGGGGGKDENEPSFDALLKQAGVDKEKKIEKPKLEKKELTADDFKKGMASITSKAQACFKGTQGTANVKLIVSPSGQVSKVAVSGVFAGKPEADCVSSAVQSATFPPWDGGPQSFTYPFLLSE